MNIDHFITQLLNYFRVDIHNMTNITLPQMAQVQAQFAQQNDIQRYQLMSVQIEYIKNRANQARQFINTFGVILKDEEALDVIIPLLKPLQNIPELTDHQAPQTIIQECESEEQSKDDMFT